MDDGAFAAPAASDGDEGELRFPPSDTIAEGELAPTVAAVELPRGTAITTPRLGAAGFEGSLASANARARDASLARLAAYFPDYDFAAAAQNVDDRRYTLLPVSDSLLQHLDAAATIDRFVTHKEHFFGPSGVTFSRAELMGHQPPPPGAARHVGRVSPGSGELVVGGLAHAIGNQWTTILNGIDRYEPRIAAVCDDLTRAYAAHINTNVYISQGKAEGFGAHWDTHDTIIVQVLGTKEWSIFEPVALSAQSPWIDRSVSDKQVAGGVLEPGMALVIPRGWGHQVHDSDDLTVHYTIGVNRLETHQLLDRVAWEVGYWPLLRADVPFDPTAPVESYGGSIYDGASGFGQTLAEVTTDDLVLRALASHRARITNRMFPSLIDTFHALHHHDWTGRAVRMPVPAGVGLVTRFHDDEAVRVVAFNNAGVQFPAAASEAFTVLAAGEACSPLDLPSIDVDSADDTDPRVRFAGDLVRAGLAEVVPA